MQMHYLEYQTQYHCVMSTNQMFHCHAEVVHFVQELNNSGQLLKMTLTMLSPQQLDLLTFLIQIPYVQDTYIQDSKNFSLNQDKDLNKIKSWLRSEIEPSQKELALSSPSVKYFWSFRSQLYLRDNILYYLWEDTVNPRYLFVAPEKMQYEILKYCHDNQSAIGQLKHMKS